MGFAVKWLKKQLDKRRFENERKAFVNEIQVSQGREGGAHGGPVLLHVDRQGSSR